MGLRSYIALIDADHRLHYVDGIDGAVVEYTSIQPDDVIVFGGDPPMDAPPAAEPGPGPQAEASAPPTVPEPTPAVAPEPVLVTEVEPAPVSAAAPVAASLDDPAKIQASRILTDRPDVLQAYYKEYYTHDEGHAAGWAAKIGGVTAEAYATYWYNNNGKYEGYAQGATTAQDNVSLDRIPGRPARRAARLLQGILHERRPQLERLGRPGWRRDGAGLREVLVRENTASGKATPRARRPRARTSMSSGCSPSARTS